MISRAPRRRAMVAAGVVAVAAALVAAGVGSSQAPATETLHIAVFAGPQNCAGPSRSGPAESRRCLMVPAVATVDVRPIGGGPVQTVRSRRDGRTVVVVPAGVYEVAGRRRGRRTGERLPRRQVTVEAGARSDVILDYSPVVPPS